MATRTKLGVSEDWLTQLDRALWLANAGDVIEVASEDHAFLAHGFALGKRGAAHGIVFEVDGVPVACPGG